MLAGVVYSFLMPLLFSYGTLQEPAVQIATFFDVTEHELDAADVYERGADYVRLRARLVSGRSAWVYVHAASAPTEPLNV